MQKKPFNIAPIVVSLWPLLVIFFIWFLFASPFFTRGTIPFSSTYQVSFFPPWSSYHLYAGPIKNAAMPDVISQIYPWKYFSILSFTQGFIPFWNPYSFSGTPFLANYQSAVLSPFNVLFSLFSFVRAWSLLVLLQPLMAGIFMYLYVRVLNVSRLGSLVSALSFMFCGFLVTWMGYATLGYAILFLPLALFALERSFYTPGRLWCILFAITFPLSFFSGHFQISLYFSFTIFAYLLYLFFQTRNVKIFLFTFLFFIFGVLLTFPQVLPSLEFYSQSLRSGLFMKGEVIPWGYLPSFLVPDFFGNPVTRNDWFGHYAEWNGYIGVLPFMLGVYALLRGFFRRVPGVRRSSIFFFSGLAIISLLLAFQTPLLDVLIAFHVPVLSTSAVSRIIVLFSFSLAVLSGIGFDMVFVDISFKQFRWIFLWLFLFFFLFLLLWIVAFFHVGIPLDKVTIAKQNLLLPSVTFGVCVFILLISFYFSQRKKMYLSILGTLLFLVVCVDLLRFSTKWQPFESPSLVFPSVGVSTFLHQKHLVDRVLGNYGAALSVYYGIPGLEGYDALYVRRYGEFISYLDKGVLGEASRSVVAIPNGGLFSPDALNLLGVRYIVYNRSDGWVGWTYPFWKYPKQFKLVYQDRAYEVYENASLFPRAFLVGAYAVLPQDRQNIHTLFLPTFHRRTHVTLEKNPSVALSPDASGSATILSYQPDVVRIQTHASGTALLFLSDVYYPGWHAQVDGKPAEILRTDYAFRSVVVPAGIHEVVFSYLPSSFVSGVIAAVIGVIGIAVLFIGSFLYRLE